MIPKQRSWMAVTGVMGQDSQECREIHSFTARNQITLVVGLDTVQSKWSLYQIVWPWFTNTAVTEQD